MLLYLLDDSLLIVAEGSRESWGMEIHRPPRLQGQGPRHTNSIVIFEHFLGPEDSSRVFPQLRQLKPSAPLKCSEISTLSQILQYPLNYLPPTGLGAETQAHKQGYIPALLQVLGIGPRYCTLYNSIPMPGQKSFHNSRAGYLLSLLKPTGMFTTQSIPLILFKFHSIYIYLSFYPSFCSPFQI